MVIKTTSRVSSNVAHSHSWKCGGGNKKRCSVVKANKDTTGLNEASSASFSLSDACTVRSSSDLQMKLIINVALKLKSVPKY